MEKFHIRFGIGVGEEEARHRFVNRSINEIFSKFFYNLHDHYEIQRRILTRLGESNQNNRSIVDYHLKNDFFKHLHAIEAFYDSLDSSLGSSYWGKRSELEKRVLNLLALSEVDLGIRWEKAIFFHPGRNYLIRL